MPSLPEHLERRIGYVLKMYPRLSETFVVDEIRALEELGAHVSIISLRPPADGRFHGDLALVRAAAWYPPRLGSQSTLGAFRVLGQLGVTGDQLGEALEFLDRLPEPRRSELLIQALHLAHRVGAERLDHLHAHFMTVAAQCAYLAHVFTGVPFSVTAHAKDIFRHGVDAEAFRQIGAAARAVVTVCDVNKVYIEEKLVDDRTWVERIYNGVFIDGADSALPRRSDLILAVGRLVEKKGFHHLVEACAVLRGRGQPLQCVIVGEGDQEERLRGQIADLDLGDSVELAGPLSRHQVAELMRTARVMVAPCVEGSDGNRDALPTVLLEALAYGLPIVSTSLGGIPEILDDGASGLLVPPDETLALVDATQRLLVDDDLWATLHHRGRARAEQIFDRRQTAAELLALFGQATYAGAGQ